MYFDIVMTLFCSQQHIEFELFQTLGGEGKRRRMRKASTGDEEESQKEEFHMIQLKREQ